MKTKDHIDAVPTRKTLIGGLAGASVVLVVGALHHYTGWRLSAEEASALTVVFSFVFSYAFKEWDR
jgi:hypothetical protein